MSSKLVPQNPEEVMVIRELVPNVTTLSVPFLRFGRIKFGGRATIVKLSTGSLAVFSPVALTPTVKSHLDSLGNQVSYIAAPDLEHHIFLSQWAAAYPSAHIIAPEGLAEKREKMNATDKSVTILPFKTIFRAENKHNIKVSEEFDAEFEYEYVEAHPNKELVFNHKPSKTLIEADLLFNLPATEQYSRTDINPTTGLWTRLFLGLQNTEGDALWQKRALFYLGSRRDRPSFDASMRRINEWKFENLVPCHGDSLVGDGKTVFEKVMQWHLQGKK
ncbi:Uncharacterized protein BP5553_01516 [Venustampulla echinocandica]|uniref:Metallo-beta-lactamase domain-containing protein n=1 Tax=Venustampulla echinocandica TaxID=2656787 RepID=A0A370U185_9HELO|nr:Uncharacterized protein BP5553_01516 [Venustampulla echinocandica]RDL41537.1 Uncharacterized protein BP5553_01516 [Venustampulla echinocandica]